MYGLSAWNIHYFYRTKCYGGCRNGAKDAVGGALESADCRPARGSPTSMRGQDASWWPGAHTSAPKAPSTYTPESRSDVSQGFGWVGKQINGWSLCRPGTVGKSEDRWMRRKAGREKEGGNRPDPEKLVSLNYPCRSTTPLLDLVQFSFRVKLTKLLINSSVRPLNQLIRNF